MSIDTITLKCVLAVAETGSFTKAADKIGRTQSAISQQIAKLEHLLGKPLFVRGKLLALTHEGDLFLGYARQMFALHCEAMDRFKQPELEGEVRFGLPENFATMLLSEVLAEFARIHPRILLNIDCDLTLNLFNRFKNHEFDLVLVKMNSPGDFPLGVDVWSEPLKWVGDSNLIEPNKPIPVVLSPNPCVYRTTAINALEGALLPWRLVLSSPSYAGVMAAVRAGMGVTVTPQSMIPNDIHAINHPLLPELQNSHVSLLKHQKENSVINALERFVLDKLNHGVTKIKV